MIAATPLLQVSHGLAGTDGDKSGGGAQAPGGSYDGAKADVFSAGATLLEVLLGHPRFMAAWMPAYYDHGQRTLEDLARSLRQATTRVITDLESRVNAAESDIIAADDAAASSGGGALTKLTNARPHQLVQLIALTISCIQLEPPHRPTSEDAASTAARCCSGGASSSPPAAHSSMFLRRQQYPSIADAAPGVDDATTGASTGVTYTQTDVRSPELPLRKNGHSFLAAQRPLRVAGATL